MSEFPAWGDGMDAAAYIATLTDEQHAKVEGVAAWLQELAEHRGTDVHTELDRIVAYLEVRWWDRGKDWQPKGPANGDDRRS